MSRVMGILGDFKLLHLINISETRLGKLGYSAGVPSDLLDRYDNVLGRIASLVRELEIKGPVPPLENAPIPDRDIFYMEETLSDIENQVSGCLLRGREAAKGLSKTEELISILVNRINLLAGRADRVRRELDRQLIAAYQELKLAVVENGRADVEAAGLAIDAGLEVSIDERSLMGVVLPLVTVTSPRFRPEYSFVDTSSRMDRVREMILSAMSILSELAEVEVGLKRLMDETRRTLKRINALSYIYIPLYEATLKSVTERLEEKEREALFQLKRMKGKVEEGG